MFAELNCLSAPSSLNEPEAAHSHRATVGWWAAVAAFGAYFCMYGFRKPFTAALYAEPVLWGIDEKSVLVISQVLGYTLSKFIGIKVIAEARPSQRARGILLLIALALIAWVAFAVAPPSVRFLCLFANGLPLGMVFGLVLGFLEGRQVTEALIAGLCASFILAGGAAKSVGAYLLQWGVNESWMPFAAGCVFLLPLCGFVWMLAKVPPPSSTDIALRSAREPMSRSARWAFFARHAVGLSLLLFVYSLITVLRSFRDDFAPELWLGMQHSAPPSIFFQTELLVMLGVVVLNGLAVFIRDNRRAFQAALLLSMTGLILVGLVVPAREQGLVGSFAFMTLVGLGLYLPYVAVHTTIFERLIAMTRDVGNLGYLMYLADAFGYLGYVGVMLARGAIGQPTSPEAFFQFFSVTAILTAALGAIALAGSWWSFALAIRPNPPAPDALAPSLDQVTSSLRR